VCVAKLFMQDRHLVENAGFIDLLREMLVDSNPSVWISRTLFRIEKSSGSWDDISDYFELIDYLQSCVNRLLPMR